jgi:hypothetical protein
MLISAKKIIKFFKMRALMKLQALGQVELATVAPALTLGYPDIVNSRKSGSSKTKKKPCSKMLKPKGDLHFIDSTNCLLLSKIQSFNFKKYRRNKTLNDHRMPQFYDN